MTLLSSHSSDPVRAYQRKGSYRTIKFLLYFCVLVGALVAFSFIIRNIVSQIKVQNGEREWLSQSLEGLIELNNNRSKAHEALTMLETAVPFREDAVQRVAPHIKDLAQARGLQVTTQLGGVATGTEGMPDMLSVSITGDGPFLSVLDLVSSLERDAMLFSIHSTDISGGKEKNAHFSIDAILYVQPIISNAQ
jgi:hypothetical protein